MGYHHSLVLDNFTLSVTNQVSIFLFSNYLIFKIYQLKIKFVYIFRTLRKYNLLKRQEKNCDKSKLDPRYNLLHAILIQILYYFKFPKIFIVLNRKA